MSYETLKAPELSPLAPCNMGVCHLPLFHVIWYQVAIVCVFFFVFFCNYITSPREMHTICVLLSCEYYIEFLKNNILQEEDVIR